MLDRTQEVIAEVAEKDLGIGIQFTVTVGQGRQIAMTAGVPLDWESPKLNGLLDKLAGAMDRQATRYEVHDREAAIENMEKQLATTRSQRETYEQGLQAAWTQRNKQGPFAMSGDQQAKSNTYKTTEQGLLVAIDKAKKDLKDARERCR